MQGEKEIKKLVAMWSLRGLLCSHVIENLSRPGRWDLDEVLELVGLPDISDQDKNKRELKHHFEAALEKLEHSPRIRRGPFFQNLQSLAEVVGLSECEKEILIFTIVLQNHPRMEKVIKFVGYFSFNQMVKDLAYVLKFKASQVEQALKKDSVLCASGLLKVDRDMDTTIESRLKPLDGLGTALQEKHQDLETLFTTYFYRGGQTNLTMEDFPHLEKEINILCPFLQTVIDRGQPGVNILFYGPPGTGKTELAKLVVQELNLRLYEVSHEDEDGDGSEGDRRFRSYLLCQRLFSRSPRCLILFDEIEDVFPTMLTALFGYVQRTGNHKGWTNRLLETNPIPAIWISNSINQIDDAFIRRFKLIVEVPVPPRSVRQKIMEKILDGIPVRERWLQHMAANENLAPAHITMAAEVASVLNFKDEDANEQLLGSLIAKTHKALGCEKVNLPPIPDGPDYNLQFINTDVDLPGLIHACGERSRGRICLYGPTGSGKTAFVHYLAQELGKPMLVRRASDLLGSYVGQTERRLAAMFREASTEAAILLLDEADSFLQDRQRAHWSWEISAVNELLVQMEAFDGLFFCATNLLETLDQAVFRRFDLKIKFDFLRPEQVWEFFQTTLQREGILLAAAEKRNYQERLAKVTCLTPGDFTAVCRGFSLTTAPMDAAMLLEKLQQEGARKPEGARRVVGFMG